MNPRGHRGIAAMLMLLALVLSAMALLPARAQASSASVTGLVSQCGSGTIFVVGAQVTLIDANGVLPSLTTTTDGAGVYDFVGPPAASYTVTVTKSGYYSNNTPEAPQVSPFRFDGSTTVTANVCLAAQPASTGVVTFAVTNGATPIGGASISAYDPARLSTPYSALIFTNTTNKTTGQSLEPLWTGSFDVRVSANGYQPYDVTQAITVSGPTTVTITLTAGVSIVGHATNASSGQFVSTGLTGWLYDAAAPKSSGLKIIPAFVNGSLFSFSAPAGTYQMIVDAKGYAAYDLPVTVTSGTLLQNVQLQPSPQELDHITVAFGTRDWNNFTVYRNLTLNPDSTLAGLQPAGLRDLRQQINYTLGTGTGAGTVSAGDVAAFRAWLLSNGPLYVTTDTFLLLNGQSFISSAASYTVSVSNSINTPGERVWINSSATYSLKSTAWIKYGQPKDYLNLTVIPDTNTTVYHNVVYLVELPLFYEMVSDRILPNPSAITTSNYTHITVDPTTTGQAIQMVLQQSFTGIARAKVIGPSGKFSVVNATYQNYQAFVANNTAITFSGAETSNPPSNDSTRDNFTWRFLANGSSIPTPANNVRYGIQPSFTFPLAGPYVVNLTAVGSGGNVSYREITIWADGSPPTPDYKTNVTGSGSAKGRNLQINQGTIIRFDGVLSSDEAYAGKTDTIPNSGYAWDFNGDHVVDATGRIVNWTFNKPGDFNVTLNVTDAVGLRGVTNATMKVTVNDTQGPAPGFTILDPTNEYSPTSTLTELRNYTFNASTTTDNYDKVSALNFTWTIPGPLIGSTGTNHTMWGENITFGWQEWNLSYNVTLTVRDTGFGSGKPNNGTLSRSINVQIDTKLHPDLAVIVGSVTIDNANPESGQTITITMNVTNKAGHGPANQVYVTVKEGTGTQTTTLSPTWTLKDKSGTTLSNLTSGTTATLKVSVTVVGQGNKTLTIQVADRNEPYTWITSENTATESIVVNQPGWVNLAIIGSVVAVFAVVIFAMYYRRKVKAGDWQPRFRRSKGGKDEGGKEKPRKEKEPKEEKKRL